MIILYIDNQHCTSLGQLRGYFLRSLNTSDDIYLDLIDNGREGIISQWLVEQGEEGIASCLNCISSELGDSEYYSQMSSIILGEDISVPSKQPFKECYTIESSDQKDTSTGVQVNINLNVVLPVNETYELRLETSWGMRAVSLNPYENIEGDNVTETFSFRKRPGIPFCITGLYGDGEQLELHVSGTGEMEFVDLGLSVKWARFNLGASSPEEYGNYYAWGETEPKNDYTEGTSKTRGERLHDISGNSNYDAATYALGPGVRIPTRSEIQELLANCDFAWTTQKGVKGMLFRSKLNNESIFLPAVGRRHGTSLDRVGEYGYYWGSTPGEDNDISAYFLYFGTDGYYSNGWYYRYNGHSVRPVQE